VSVITLCPLLELEDTQEPTALGRLKRKDWRDDERTNLIGLPAENTKYADMVLTDPPVDEVKVELTYKHILEPRLTIIINRSVTSKVGPLTFSAALANACTQQGDTCLYEPPMPSNNYSASLDLLSGTTMNDVAFQAVQKHGGSFVLDPKKSQFIFPSPRIVVPSNKERMDMEANRAQ